MISASERKIPIIGNALFTFTSMQDYKHIHYNSAKRKQEVKSSKKTSVFFLFALIVIICAGIFLQRQSKVEIKTEQPVNGSQENQDSPARFTFYDILASGEVIVSKDLIVEPQKEEVYLQLGAFKSDAEADNFQAELNLKGFHPQVQSLFLPAKTGRWFIVRIGKVRDDQELDMLKQQLEQNQIEYAIVSRKGFN